ncbi:MAG: YafY family protein [Ktedonobacterales bacterium]
MYHPTTRVLTVLELLQSHHRITGVQLAERLEVDVRTVRRYITMLQELGIPVQAERGRYGAYRLLPGFKLPPLMFSEDEALALTLGLLTARRLGLTLATPAVEGALAKVERVLPATLRARVQAVQETVRLDLVPPAAAPANAVVVTLSTAAQQGRWVALRYRSARSQDSERIVEPYGLVYQSGRWYAPAYCHLRAGLRLFRLDRVMEAQLREETFVRPLNFDSLAFVHQSLATAPGTWLVRAVLDTTLERARQVVPAQQATLAVTDEGVELRCYAEDLDWMARFLISLGFPFAVREPAELRETLRALAAAITRAAITSSQA